MNASLRGASRGAIYPVGDATRMRGCRFIIPSRWIHLVEIKRDRRGPG